MAYQSGTVPEEVAAVAVHCPVCGWRGIGADTAPEPCSALCCPRCKSLVEKEHPPIVEAK